MNRWILIAVLATAACGGDDGGGATSDANPDNAGCLPGSYDVDAMWPFETGPHAIAGTVTLPASAPAGRAVQLEMIEVDPAPGGNYLEAANLSAATATITYRASGLPDGTWKICLRVDVDGNLMTGDVGTDYIGCFDGTEAAPIKMSAMATPIVLGGACQSGKDFGVAVR